MESKLKWCLITGASSGIGKELAMVFAEQEYALILIARRKEKLSEVALTCEKLSGNKVITVIADLSDEKEADNVYQTVKQYGIQIDILVNNAGRGLYGDFQSYSWHDIANLMYLNMMTATKLIHLFLPDLKLSANAKILSVSSIAGYQPTPLFSIYAASKNYILFLSAALQNELQQHQISVTTLCPGATKTEFSEVANMENTRCFHWQWLLSEPKEVAVAGYNGLMRNKAIVIPGFMNKCMIISQKFLPKALLRCFAKWYMNRT